MIHTTRWQPDTCGCTIEYTWDDEEQRETRTLTPVKIDGCPAHASMPLADAFKEIRAENRRKNLVVAAAAEAAGCGPDQITWKMTPEREFVAEPQTFLDGANG